MRQARERGRSRTDWLDSRHTFAFGDYRDPANGGFRNLRVINEDRVAPGGGFAPHGHRDMEIVTLVLAGALAHRDSLGNGSVIRPGEVQRMSAGTGITHSEMNASGAEPVHFLQIWVEPERAGAAPGYAQQALAPRRGVQWLVTADGREGSLRWNAQADLARVALASGEAHAFAPLRSKHGWVHVVRGAATLAGFALGEGDAVALDGEASAEIVARGDTELLLFDLR